MNMIEKQRNCKAKQRKMKAYQNDSCSKCHKPKKKVDVENLNLHNTILQREYVDDNLHNNATTRHNEEDIDSEMQSKRLRI